MKGAHKNQRIDIFSPEAFTEENSSNIYFNPNINSIQYRIFATKI